MPWSCRDPDYCMSTYIELWHVKLTLSPASVTLHDSIRLLRFVTMQRAHFPSALLIYLAGLRTNPSASPRAHSIPGSLSSQISLFIHSLRVLTCCTLRDHDRLHFSGWEEQLTRRLDILECVPTLHGSHCGLTPWRAGLCGVMVTMFWCYPGLGGAGAPETCR
jgi:hypothetical protein